MFGREIHAHRKSPLKSHESVIMYWVGRYMYIEIKWHSKFQQRESDLSGRNENNQNANAVVQLSRRTYRKYVIYDLIVSSDYDG